MSYQEIDDEEYSPPEDISDDIDADTFIDFIEEDRTSKSISEVQQGLTRTPESISEEARVIYESGEFIDYCKGVFGKTWHGDSFILMAALLTAANIRVLNASDALHIHVSGQTQSGKSGSVKAALRFIPQTEYYIGAFSPMYLFYAGKSGELHEGMIVFSDDTVLSEEVAGIYRNMLTSWFTGVKKGTVIKGEPVSLYIPKRVSLMLTSVDDVVDTSVEGQDESRFLTLEVRRTKEQLRDIAKFIQLPSPDIRGYLNVVYAIWDRILPRTVYIHREIELSGTIREFTRYLTLIKAHALLCNRDTTDDTDIAAIDEFLSYSKPMLNSTTAAFTRNEAAVRGCLTDFPKTIAQISKESGLPIRGVYTAIRGKSGTFDTPSGGLMMKEPRLIFKVERSELQNQIFTLQLRKLE